jgi:hypothetical protein
MTKLGKKIEDIMSAVSFAEEGDFNTAREILKKEKRVLLAANNGNIDYRALKYAVNTCKRISAGLDILIVSSRSENNSKLKQTLNELETEGIKHMVSEREGCLKQAIVDYTNSEKDILFVVIESTDELETGCAAKTKKLSEAWQRLRCPLVVVTGGAKA